MIVLALPAYDAASLFYLGLEPSNEMSQYYFFFPDLRPVGLYGTIEMDQSYAPFATSAAARANIGVHMCDTE